MSIPPPILIEDTTDTATGSEPIYTRGGAVEMVNIRCENWGGKGPPIVDLGRTLDTFARRRPGQPRCVKLSWFLTRSSDATNPDTSHRPGVDQIVDAFRAGSLKTVRADQNGDSDASLTAPLGAELKQRNEQPDIILVNNEAACGPWAFTDAPTPGTPWPSWARSFEDWTEKVQQANDRNRAIMHAVLFDDISRSKLASSLQSIPKNIAAIDDAFNQFGSQRELFGPRQRDWLARWNTIRTRSVRLGLQRSSMIGPKTRVFVSFAGDWPRFVCDDNGHEVGPIIMPPGVYANWQCYGSGGVSVMRAAAMAQAPGAMLTFHADHSAGDIDQYLQHAAPNGAFLYTEKGPAHLDHLIDSLARRTAA